MMAMTVQKPLHMTNITKHQRIHMGRNVMNNDSRKPFVIIFN